MGTGVSARRSDRGHRSRSALQPVGCRRDLGRGRRVGRVVLDGALRRLESWRRCVRRRWASPHSLCCGRNCIGRPNETHAEDGGWLGVPRKLDAAPRCRHLAPEEATAPLQSRREVARSFDFRANDRTNFSLPRNHSSSSGQSTGSSRRSFRPLPPGRYGSHWHPPEQIRTTPRKHLPNHSVSAHSIARGRSRTLIEFSVLERTAFIRRCGESACASEERRGCRRVSPRRNPLAHGHCGRVANGPCSSGR